ncbi:uncharacterized protein LOC124335730 isoform X3 [Daphnia pulicaria]|uniref:uncharacterized protein LOC124335730 isoform X3 n=1 Tax=Daphnia pulicaria TaxID=35523 RepID=UPI001EEC1985|nr:uncharacterized protein LOC124335730 isoform X3 [Daphnia pulicaria]
MDSYKRRNRGPSNHYSKYQPNYCDESSPRESFDGNYARSSKSNSESPNSHRTSAQSTFECRVCLNTYQSNRELYAHLHAAQHLRPLSRLNVPEDEETFPNRKRKHHGIFCKVCFHEFDTHNELKKHLTESGHHWSAKRVKHMSSHDKTAYEHEYSDRRRHSSSTDTRSDRSFACQNPDLVAAEESRGKDPSPGSRARSYGCSVVLDDPAPVPVLEKDISALGGDNSGSSKVKMPMISSNLGTDHDQSIITSPDSSILVSSKISNESPSTSEIQKGMAVIPMETSVPATDPRRKIPSARLESDKKESRNLNTKWAPIYCDRPKPNLVEKRIPWKLIPIDLVPSNYPGNQLSDSRASNPRIPSPTEDVSIDQLAAQLKENTGNLMRRFSRDVISTCAAPHPASSPDDRASIQSPVPCPDGARGVQENHTVTKSVVDLDGKSATNRTGELMDKEPWNADSTSCSPSSPKCDHGTSSHKSTEAEIPSLRTNVIPPLIPRPVIDRQVEADILEALGSLNSMLDASELLLSKPIQSASSEVLTSNNAENVDVPQSPVIVEDKSQYVTLSLTAENVVQSVESCSLQILGESVKEEVANVDSPGNSSTSSPKPAEQSVTTEEVVDSCPSCQTLLDILGLKIDLKTGNASVTCLGCDVHIVMANVFKKL